MNRNSLILIALILASVGAAVGLYMYDLAPEKASEQDAAFSLPAGDLVTQFMTDEAQAQSTYLNQIIRVEGRISQKSETPAGMVIIMEAGTGTVNCAFEPEANEELKDVAIGDALSVKGFCTGYADLFSEVSLARCVQVK